MGKEQSIRQVEQELLKTETYLFRHLQEKLQKQGVAKDHEIMQTLEVLVNQTWASSRQNNIKVNQKYEKKLKMMTILSLFFGATVCNLTRLEKELASKRQEVLNLLVEANIAKLISVHIDQEKGLIKILKSKIRERDSTQEREKYISGKLIHIKDKNQRLESEISNIIGLIVGGEKQPVQRLAPRRAMGIGMPF